MLFRFNLNFLRHRDDRLFFFEVRVGHALALLGKFILSNHTTRRILDLSGIVVPHGVADRLLLLHFRNEQLFLSIVEYGKLVLWQIGVLVLNENFVFLCE